MRGIEILRCGAQTPSSRLRGYKMKDCNYYPILCPRRWTLGASPHSVGIYSHVSHTPFSASGYC